jgi:hypothetical protein
VDSAIEVLSDPIERLNALILLEYRAAEAYQVAIGRTDNPHHASKLRALMADHLRNTGELAHLMRELGGEPRQAQTDVRS